MSIKLKYIEKFNELKTEIANLKYAIIELEYKGDDIVINEIIDGINARLDAIEARLNINEGWKSLAQDKLGNIQDQIASINEIPSNHEDRLSVVESKVPTIDNNTTRLGVLEDAVFE